MLIESFQNSLKWTQNSTIFFLFLLSGTLVIFEHLPKAQPIPVFLRPKSHSPSSFWENRHWEEPKWGKILLKLCFIWWICQKLFWKWKKKKAQTRKLFQLFQFTSADKVKSLQPDVRSSWLISSRNRIYRLIMSLYITVSPSQHLIPLIKYKETCREAAMLHDLRRQVAE